MKIFSFNVLPDIAQSRLTCHQLTVEVWDEYKDRRESLRKYYTVCQRTQLVWFEDEPPPESTLAILEAAGVEMPKDWPPSQIGPNDGEASTSDFAVGNEFVLEKYLEDFIVSNFEAIFDGRLEIHERQYATDIGSIDILAKERESGSFVVIELKKGRPSDNVVGQICGYMGWVKKHLCGEGQSVKGLIICRSADPKLQYALETTEHVDVLYYKVSFKLSKAP